MSFPTVIRIIPVFIPTVKAVLLKNGCNQEFAYVVNPKFLGRVLNYGLIFQDFLCDISGPLNSSALSRLPRTECKSLHTLFPLCYLLHSLSCRSPLTLSTKPSLIFPSRFRSGLLSFAMALYKVLCGALRHCHAVEFPLPDTYTLGVRPLG